MLAKTELGISIEEDIQSHIRIWGHADIIDVDTYKTLYEKWNDFMNTVKK